MHHHYIFLKSKINGLELPEMEYRVVWLSSVAVEATGNTYCSIPVQAHVHVMFFQWF